MRPLLIEADDGVLSFKIEVLWKPGCDSVFMLRYGRGLIKMEGSSDAYSLALHPSVMLAPGKGTAWLEVDVLT